jgi:hypothetical protein
MIALQLNTAMGAVLENLHRIDSVETRRDRTF